MKIKKTIPEPVSHRLTRWQAVHLKQIRPVDLLHMAVILILGVLAVWTGRMMSHHMTPVGAVEISRGLDELQMPRQLPDMPIVREDGQATTLWKQASKKRNIITVYAPWCPACQKELPILNEALADTDNLIVLISNRQDAEEVKEQLDNLGITGLHFYRDVTGEILKQGKVSKLPTTFLLRNYGKVLDRLVGLSEYRLKRLINQATEQMPKDE